jgi:hypothetical protein
MLSADERRSRRVREVSISQAGSRQFGLDVLDGELRPSRLGKEYG